MGRNAIEEIFMKSDSHSATCSHCGGDIDDDVEKAMKCKRKSTAAMIGNEMDPHEGGKTGSQIKHTRPGMKVSGGVDRDHAKNPRAPNSVFQNNKGGKMKKSEESVPLFANAKPFQAVRYFGDDTASAEKIESGDLDGGSQRNLRMEQASNQSDE